MTLPRGASGKASAVLLAGVVLLAIYQIVVVPIAAVYAERDTRLADMTALANRLERAAADEPRLRRDMAALQDAGGRPDTALPGTTDALAAATLQGLLSDLIGDTGARLSSTEILPPIDNVGGRQVGIRLSFAGDLSQLTSVLSGIESTRPALRTDNLELARESATDAPLKVSLDVFGYRAAQRGAP
jgi:hypothetical protein